MLKKLATPFIIGLALIYFQGCAEAPMGINNINEGASNLDNIGNQDQNLGDNNAGKIEVNHGNTDLLKVNPIVDTDGDGIANIDDPDIDGDGINNNNDNDIDGDGILNVDDPDIDGDGILNIDDNDIDGDGILNINDNDIDGDGLLNIEDPDIDGDGILNINDNDIDGDGITNDLDVDIDGDNIINTIDKDIDGDGINNNNDNDIDGDGIINEVDADLDGDGIPNSIDPDIDGDGILNENDNDLDGDGILNVDDPDVDGDGILNPQDPDDDGDGIPDGQDPTPIGNTDTGGSDGPSATTTITDKFTVDVDARGLYTGSETINFDEIRQDLRDDNINIQNAEIQNVMVRADTASFPFFDKYAAMEYELKVYYQLNGSNQKIQILHTPPFGSTGFPTQTVGGLKDGSSLIENEIFVDIAAWAVFSQLFKDETNSGITMFFEFEFGGTIDPADHGTLNMEYFVDVASTGG